ncbi:RNA-binding S4 domain-containing protein [Tomitella biformata]|uniref:RNA-binding S4 domain-containing protein n=1 Tax=Tomitella biformata TaxID=630403 RepID=UPI0004649A2C|nr:RNA-binding S4 domain-containing protein [Tomitella biformata]
MTSHRSTPENSAPAVQIRDESIRLGQFLKLANLLESGAEAKQMIAEGQVDVNGETEFQRGRQLRDGDLVEVFDMSARVEGPQRIADGG